MLGQMELFKLVHWNSKDGWINQEAKDCYVSLIYLRNLKSLL